MRTRALTWMTVAALAASGCGGDGGGGGKGAGAGVAAPTTPAESDCATARLRTSVAPDDLVTPPGRYRYRTAGTKRVEGQSAQRLPGASQTLVTRPRSAGQLRCFRVQRRYGAGLVDTATFVVRGGDVYATQLEAAAGGDLLEIRPEPPIRVLADGETEWGGAFGGATSGRYVAQVIGQRTFRVDGASVKAVGIDVRTSFQGELEGSEHSVRWVALDGNVVVEEEVEQRRDFGLDRVVMRHRSRLAKALRSG
ncbi:MAG TPA: hypothetical protein VF712_10485 [Thermoleophilaceae bacterium]|jgi:hypothetical protein